MHTPQPFRHACRICGNVEGNQPYDVREMMFGTRESFRYVLCAACGSLQIAEGPSDMARYYPAGYYSLDLDPSSLHSGGVLGRWMKRRRDAWEVLRRGILGWLLAAIAPNQSLRKLAPVRLRPASRVLDVGCGTGRILYTLRTIGFRNLLGIDPYLERDIEYDNGLRVERKTLAEVEGQFDLIMFNHSLEHMADQVSALLQAAALLSPEGMCLVRVPLVDSWAWQHYGTNWVQIDAPRHFCVHSAASMDILSEKCGFVVSQVHYDSSEFQFWGSEQYARDIPLRSSRPRADAPAASIFTDEEIAGYRRRAVDLNRERRGDQAGFYLTKKP